MTMVRWLGAQRLAVRWVGMGLGGLALCAPSVLLAQAPEGEPAGEVLEAAPDDPSAEAPPADEPTTEEVPPPAPASVTSPDVPTCAGAAREIAASSVVRVRSGAEWGAGFVYGTPRTIVTSFGLVALGQSVTVVTRDGTRVEARVVARDEPFDMVILETTEDVPGATPLAPAPETSAMVGRPVIALGHPFAAINPLLGERGEGLLRWSVSQGTIGAANDVGIQADVALNEGHAGAPLLDCEGRVLGMVTGTGILSGDLGLVARVARADALLEQAETTPSGDFLGNLRLRLGIGAVLQIDEDGRVAAGGYLTLGAVLFDRVSWMNRVGLLFGGAIDGTESELSVDRRLVRVESLLGYRFFVDIGGFTTLYIVPAAGLTIGHFDETRRSVEVVPVAGCTPSDTESCAAARIVQTSTEAWRVRPAIGLTFLLAGSIELGYTLEIDVEEPVQTFHNVNFGVLF